VDNLPLLCEILDHSPTHTLQEHRIFDWTTFASLPYHHVNHKESLNLEKSKMIYSPNIFLHRSEPDCCCQSRYLSHVVKAAQIASGIEGVGDSALSENGISMADISSNIVLYRKAR